MPLGCIALPQVLLQLVLKHSAANTAGEGGEWEGRGGEIAPLDAAFTHIARGRRQSVDRDHKAGAYVQLI